MNNEKLDRALRRIAPDVERDDNVWLLAANGHQVFIITDERADRMRIMSPVVDNSALTPDLAVRLMQANFDSALDARYAIAKGKLWSVFIHPLSPLTDKELKSGLHQVVTLVRSYGGSFSSGGLQFGGGDSRNSVTEDKPRELEPL